MRILIAGTGSGCGKTAASLVLMSALRQSGYTVLPYKTGPDYIDPGFHAAVCGTPSRNLDAFLMEPGDLRSELSGRDGICVIEGVMGYYDGLNVRTLEGSTWEMARLTESPVLLLADASGGAASVAAQVSGFLHFVPESRIAAVLPTRVSGASHYALIRDAVQLHTGLPCAGWIGKDGRLSVPSRHLGLVQAKELPELTARIDAAARDAAKTLDLDLILSLAASAPELNEAPRPVSRGFGGFRLGIAMDEAFGFYYDANLRLLAESGMEFVPFSPMRDAALPEKLDGLYLGGGYPEVFADALEGNTSMRESIRGALEDSLRCYAECGGLLYLCRTLDGHAMADFFPIRAEMTPRLQRFGYVRVEDRTGLTFPAHEFHHAVCTPLEEIPTAYRITKASRPEKEWRCGYERNHTLGAFAHLHFLSHPELIRRLWG